MADKPADTWKAGTLYEPYVGRWSRPVAHEFLRWLDVASGGEWLDVGCGTGALSETILQQTNPRRTTGIDPSAGFIAYAREHVRDPRARFDIGDAQSLPVETEAFDAAVSGLVLNFVPDPAKAIAEKARAVRSGGVVAAYVWDYAGKMELMRYFWDAAVALDAQATQLDEGRRFPLCRPDRLAALFEQAELEAVRVESIDVATPFRDFDDYWAPFLGGQGPAPSYAMALEEARRAALRERLRTQLPAAVDGSIPLTARAWAVAGRKR